MESTLFTVLTPNEEANLSGGTSKVDEIKAKLESKKVAFAINNTKQTAIGGKGGNGGNITIGGGKGSPVVIVKSNVSADGGNGGDATNFNETAQGVAN
ncbi:hypothetical protein [Nostoc sp. UHCC 0251]|uniref:hypothetical protein n=1 Tax=Nostoc sp. UHCC 0251 TaxID=3110240 RepID=UPI002B201A8C|nr:hypothetical protein [Nostoc sp. UHCC 0251]MEA5626517.1 hypothetical protein [Nostoc sp. UHCC 0251]